MYRLLTASKDTYITNKYISGKLVTGSNVGQAGTLDLFKLHNETTLTDVSGPIQELTRLMVQFDYGELRALTGSILDYTTGSFQAIMHLKDVYGGQTTPSNFTVKALPLSKSFDEGRGFDVVSFRDLDAANWVTASLSPIVTWSQPGAGASGTLGTDVDAITSGNLGGGVVGLGRIQNFKRGDEDLMIDVTHLVSASLAGVLPNDGFHISFTAPQEQDTKTRFVKRFGSRHTLNKNLHPKLIVKYDGDRIFDPGFRPRFDVSQSLYVYNSYKGQHVNFISGGKEVTGSNSLIMELVSSKSVKFTTSSFSPSHSASITFLTSSFIHFSRSFTGSQVQFGSLPQKGIYSAPFILPVTDDSELRKFVGNRDIVPFDVKWKSLDGVLTYSMTHVNFVRVRGEASNAMQQNLVVNMTNLQDEYHSNQVERLRVFANDYNLQTPSFKLPTILQSVVLPDMRWRVVKAFTREVVIPWSEATRMSTDQDGMYFDMYFGDLDINEVYEFELLIKNEFSRDHTITNQGFRFKVKA